MEELSSHSREIVDAGVAAGLYATPVPLQIFAYRSAQLDQVNEQMGYFEPRPWHRDRPQVPKVWAKDPNAANYWGIMPGDEMHK